MRQSSGMQHRNATAPVDSTARKLAETIRRARPPRKKEDDGYKGTLLVAALILAWLLMVTLLASIKLHAEVTIHAPRKRVWKRALDMARWHRMDGAPFQVDIAGRPEVGKRITITSTWRDGRTDVSHERITVVEPHERVCWDFEGLPNLSIPDWLLGTERCLLFEEVGDRGRSTRVSSYEIFSGPAGVMVGLLLGNTIQDGFGRWCEGLLRQF